MRFNLNPIKNGYFGAKSSLTKVYAGNDQKVYFLDKQGNSQSRFDCSSNKKIREFTGAFFNPTGDSVVLANFSGFLVFNFCPRRKIWQKKGHFDLKNYYSISSACWKPDGSQFISSNLCAALDVFSVSVKKVSLENGRFEVDFVAHNKLKVRQMKGAVSEFEVESSFGLEIENLRMRNCLSFIESCPRMPNNLYMYRICLSISFLIIRTQTVPPCSDFQIPHHRRFQNKKIL